MEDIPKQNAIVKARNKLKSKKKKKTDVIIWFRVGFRAVVYVTVTKK
jgi:hypothetical protein